MSRVEQTKRLSCSLGMASTSMVALGYSGDFLVRWSWWVLAMVPFRFVAFQRPHDQIECPSLLIRSRSGCEDQPCVTGFVAGFAHQVTAHVGAEVKAFNAYAKWCHDQALDEGHQQETLDASIVSKNAAIEKFAAKAENAMREEAKDFGKSEAECLDVPSSEQQLVDCVTVDFACNDEFTNNGFAFDKKSSLCTETVSLLHRNKGHLRNFGLNPWIAHESVAGHVNVPTDGEQNFNVEVIQKSVPISFESDQFSLNHTCLMC